jgi:hypothetical protein
MVEQMRFVLHSLSLSPLCVYVLTVICRCMLCVYFKCGKEEGSVMCVVFVCVRRRASAAGQAFDHGLHVTLSQFVVGAAPRLAEQPHPPVHHQHQVSGGLINANPFHSLSVLCVINS